MTITVITAPPRTGKSLYAVWRMNQSRDKYHIISNIDGYDGDEKLGTANDIISYLVSTNWEVKAVEAGKKLLLVIDEAQQIYGTVGMDKGKQQELLFLLEYHGHYGMDIWLITQSNRSLHSRVSPLVSELIEISKIKLGKNRRFRIKDPITFEEIETGTFNPTQKDYDSYRSARNDEGLQENRSPMKRLIIMGGIGAVVALIAIGLMVTTIMDWIDGMGGDKHDASSEVHESMGKDVTTQTSTSTPAPTPKGSQSNKVELPKGIGHILKIEKPRMVSMTLFNDGRVFNDTRKPIPIKRYEVAFSNEDCSLSAPRIWECESIDFQRKTALCNGEVYFYEPCPVDEGEPETGTPADLQIGNGMGVNPLESFISSDPSVKGATLGK